MNHVHVERRRFPARDVKETVVGAISLGVLGLAIGLSYGGAALTPPPGYRVDATFNRVDGLLEGSEVRLGGVRVGFVESMRLDPYYRAVVSLRVTAGARLPTDTSAAIHTDGLFGAKFVVLEPGGADETFKDGATITFTQDAVIITELLDMIIAQGNARRAAADGSEDTNAAGQPAGGAKP